MLLYVHHMQLKIYHYEIVDTFAKKQSIKLKLFLVAP